MDNETRRDRSASGSPNFTDSTGFLLQWAHRGSRRAFNEALQPLAIEARHYGTLLLLGVQGPLSQRQLAGRLDLDKSSMVYIIDDLTRNGLAERRQAPHDRRAYAVHITDKGREVLGAAKKIAEGVEGELFQCLNAEEKSTLNRLLARVIESMPKPDSRVKSAEKET